MIVLSIDTTLEACQAAVLDADRVRAGASEPMQRGHQERLATLVAEVMAASGLGFEALDRVGVTVGPGSFSGVRVGLAFAKGLGLALGIPCVGIGALEALAATAGGAGKVAAAIDARRGQVYLQLYERGAPVSAPEAVDLKVAIQRIETFCAGEGVLLVGTGSSLLAPGLAHASVGSDRPDPVVIARLARDAPSPLLPPRPVYLRAPDARLPA